MYFSGDAFSKSDLNYFHFCVFDSKQTLWKNNVFPSVKKKTVEENNSGINLFLLFKTKKNIHKKKKFLVWN